MRINSRTPWGKKTEFTETIGGYGICRENDIGQKIIYLQNLQDTSGKHLIIYIWFHRTADFDVNRELLENDVIGFTAGIDHLPAQTPIFDCQLQSSMNVRELGSIPTFVSRGMGRNAHILPLSHYSSWGTTPQVPQKGLKLELFPSDLYMQPAHFPLVSQPVLSG